MSKLLIRSGQIISMTSEQPEILESDILIEGNKIVSIDNNISAEGVDRTIDARGKVIIPGLVNCHNHAAMVLFRGYSDDLRLMEWLSQKIWPAEDRLTSEDIYWGTMLACNEMIKSGTTTFADMYFYMEDVARAVEQTGLRASLCQGLVFNDEYSEKRLQASRDLFKNWNGGAGGRISVMIGPHAPFTCPPDKMKLAMELAGELRAPIHIHLAETVEEVNQMFEWYGKSPTKYLADLGLLSYDHVVLAHAVNLSRDDLYLLRELKGGIAHNPVSNQKLGCGTAPVIELRELGVTVGLGTDGAGSATTLDMFEEIKAAAWLQKNKTGDPTSLTAYEVLKMATIEGARTLGLDREIGTLEPGKKADIIIIDMDKPHLYPQNDIFALLAYSANGADVDTVIIDGEIIMQGRQIQPFDEKEVMQRAQDCADRVLR